MAVHQASHSIPSRRGKPREEGPAAGGRCRAAVGRIRLLLAGAASILLGCVYSEQTVNVPVKESAAEQYSYAIQYRQDKNLKLIVDKKKFLKAREVVRQVINKVSENFPDDRMFTPLAKLDAAEMDAGLDDSRVEVSRRQVHQAIERLGSLAKDYPEYDYIQAKSLYDRGLCYKRLGEFPQAQECFKEVRDRFKKHANKEIRRIVDMAVAYYNQTYVNE
jgi:tetratricopeptide (TPR) repeat protein